MEAEQVTQLQAETTKAHDISTYTSQPLSPRRHSIRGSWSDNSLLLEPLVRHALCQVEDRYAALL